MTEQIEIPENTCKGCEARDRIIQSLARKVDELEGNNKLELVETAEELEIEGVAA